MRRTFWSLMLTGVAITALAGFSPTTQEAEAGLFSRLRAKFSGGSCNCLCDAVTSCCPPTCCPPAPPPCCPPAPVTCCPPAPTCCPAPCDACGHHGCNDCDSDNDHDDDCDD